MLAIEDDYEENGSDVKLLFTLVPEAQRLETTKKKLAPLSDKQLSFIRYSNAPINIAHGGVRGGKNFAINIRLIRYFKEEPFGDPEALFGFIGATKATVKRNILNDLKKIVGPKNFKYNSQSGEGAIFGRVFQVFDYKDSKSVERLRGSTLGGAVITEASFCPEHIFDEVMFRLTDDEALLFCDTNPDNPYHWLFTKYINNQEQINAGIVKVWHFTYLDNLSLGEGYAKKLLSLYKKGSLKYERFVMGRWVAGEGTIFDNFNTDKHVLEHSEMSLLSSKMKIFLLSLDPGTVNAFAGLKIGVLNDNYYVLDEYYYDSQEKGKQKTEGEYCEDIAKFSKDTISPNLIIDPSRASFIFELKKNFRKALDKYSINLNNFTIKEAFNDVLSGIDICNSLFNQDKIFISDKCTNLLQQISNYVWDKKSALRGIEQPLKVADHTCDAFRYGIATHYKTVNLPTIKNSIGSGRIDYSNDYL